MIVVENLKIQKVVTSYLVVYNWFTFLQAKLLQLSTLTVVPSIILVANNKKSVWCEQCPKFRRNLYVCILCLEKRTPNQTDSSSSVPYCALSTKEMSERMKNLHNELGNIRKK